MHKQLTTIVTSETFVNSSMESCRSSGNRAYKANGDRINDYSALGHFRHELYTDGRIICVYFVVCLKVWLHINPYWPSKTLLMHS